MSLFRRLLSGFSGKKAAPSTLGDTIGYYRQLGFFRDQTAEQIATRHREEWGDEPQVAKVWDEVFLLGYDTTKVWTGDPEADVCQENQVYCSTLPEWAQITGGVFVPEDIQETWESDEGPIKVSFLLNGERVSLHPKYEDDWIDLEVLVELNELLKPTGQRFNCAVDGNFCLLVFVSAEMEKKLRTERGFPFALP